MKKLRRIIYLGVVIAAFIGIFFSPLLRSSTNAYFASTFGFLLNPRNSAEELGRAPNYAPVPNDETVPHDGAVESSTPELFRHMPDAMRPFILDRVDTIFIHDVPRVCLLFDRLLAAQPAKPFGETVQVQPAIEAARFEVEGSRLCISGFAGADRFTIALSKDFAAANGETLGLDEEAAVTLGPRPKNLALTSPGLVLAPNAAGFAEGMMAESLNIKRLRLSVLEVAAPLLKQILGEPAFTKSDAGDLLSRNMIRRLLAQGSEIIWSGAVDVADQPDRSVATLLPLPKMLGARKSSLDLVIAEDADTPTQIFDGARDVIAGDGVLDTGVAARWLLKSSISLSALSTGEGLHVFARNTDASVPAAKVLLHMISTDQHEMASGVTDGDGRVFLRRHTGTPAYLLGSGPAGELAYLNLAEANSASGDRTPEPAARDPDVQLVTPNNAWLPDEEASADLKLRDSNGGSVENRRGSAFLTVEEDWVPLAEARDYQFGDAAERETTPRVYVRMPIATLPTDRDGRARFSFKLPSGGLPTLPLRAVLRAGVFQPNGSFPLTSIERPLRSAPLLIGIKAIHPPEPGAASKLLIRTFDSDGEPVARRGLRWVLRREQAGADWDTRTIPSAWHTSPVVETIAKGEVDVSSRQPAELSQPVDLGALDAGASLFTVSDPATQVTTTIRLGLAACVVDANCTAPITIRPDQERPRVGDTLHLSFTAPYPGRARLDLVGSGGIESRILTLARYGSGADLKFTDEDAPGITAVLTLLDPPSQSLAAAFPKGAIGTVWIGPVARPPSSTLSVIGPFGGAWRTGSADRIAGSAQPDAASLEAPDSVKSDPVTLCFEPPRFMIADDSASLPIGLMAGIFNGDRFHIRLTSTGGVHLGAEGTASFDASAPFRDRVTLIAIESGAASIEADIAGPHDFHRHRVWPVIVKAKPLAEAQPGGAGLSLNKSYFDLDGKPVSVTSLRTGTELIVSLTGTASGNAARSLRLQDGLPSGWRFDGVISGRRAVNPLDPAADVKRQLDFDVPPVPPSPESGPDYAFLGRLTPASIATTLDGGIVFTMPAGEPTFALAYLVRITTSGAVTLPGASLFETDDPSRINSPGAEAARTATARVEMLPLP